VYRIIYINNGILCQQSSKRVDSFLNHLKELLGVKHCEILRLIKDPNIMFVVKDNKIQQQLIPNTCTKTTLGRMLNYYYLTPDLVADLLGVREICVDRWVRGISLPPPHLRKQVSRLLGLRVEDIFNNNKPLKRKYTLQKRGEVNGRI
jgi:hypothetical protein